jgi:arylsulfatase A-like enzyme
MRLVAGRMHGEPGAARHPAVYHSEREGDVPPLDQEGVPPEEITLAELLRTRGYRTLGLGKWHLGETPALRPEAQGFDEYLGFYPGGSLYLDVDDPQSVNSVQEFDGIDAFLWANLPFAVRKNGSARFAPSEYMTDYLSKEAVKAIDANRHRPFFLYFAPNAPHTPLQALRSDYDALPQIADHRLRVYAAMIRALDRAVGRILAALDANGLADNTLVFFTSDNGGANYIGLPDINRPYRGWKMTFFEGGVHTPLFARWPAAVPARRRSRRRSRTSTSRHRRGGGGAPAPPIGPLPTGRPAAVGAGRAARAPARCRLLALAATDGARRRLEARSPTGRIAPGSFT